jgi:dihydroxyacetone kinase-like predicted kinase
LSDPSLVRFRAALQGALAHLESRREEINDLNVFPVADGDTGDNMALTLKACLAELDRLSQVDRPLDLIVREEIVSSVARAALLGARGNSGVILSQLIRGAAEELISRPGELVDPVLIGAAMARAAQRAYASVREPAEGTMLTVMRDMAAAVASELAHMGETRLNPGASAEEQNRMLADILERAVAAGEESVRRSPELLPVLKASGVVDAGGYGVIVVLAGVVAALRGDEAPQLAHHAPARITHPQHESSTYRYCTNFAVTGTALAPAPFVDALEELGDSVLVVGDESTLKVHVHTDDPEAATALFEGIGEVSRLDVADMRVQVHERDMRLGTPGNGASLRGAGGRGRRRDAPAVRVARRPCARRRRDAQPLHLRAAGGHPRGPGRAGGRAAQQSQRLHGGRARRGALRQGGARRADALAAGGPVGGRRAEPRPWRRAERRGDGAGAGGGAHRRRRARGA